MALGHGHPPIYELRVKTVFLDNSKLVLWAVDSLGQDDHRVNGIYPVELDGFEHSLFFLLGRSQYPVPLKNSTFLYIKPLSPGNPKPSLYVVLRWGAGIFPYKISLFWLVAIPMMIVFALFLFRKMIFFVLILVILFFVFNKGLNPATYLKSVYDWVVFHLHPRV